MLFDKVLDELLLRLIPLIFEQSFPSFKTGILEENLHWLSNDKSRLSRLLPFRTSFHEPTALCPQKVNTRRDGCSCEIHFLLCFCEKGTEVHLSH